MTNCWTPKHSVRADSRAGPFNRFCAFIGEIMSARNFCQQLCGQIRRRSENYHESEWMSLEGPRKGWKHTRMCREWRISAKWRLQSDKFCTRVTATERWSSLPAGEWRDGMCERSAEIHYSSSSSSSSTTTTTTSSSSSSSSLPFPLEIWQPAILTADLKLNASQEFHWIQSRLVYKWWFSSYKETKVCNFVMTKNINQTPIIDNKFI